MAVRIGVLLLALVVAACSGDESQGGTTTIVEASPPSTAPAPSTTTTIAAPTTGALPVSTGELGVLDAALSPDGTLGLEQALALVAAGYAPIPGVTPAATPLVDGGPALRTALTAGDDLRDDQRAALASDHRADRHRPRSGARRESPSRRGRRHRHRRVHVVRPGPGDAVAGRRPGDDRRAALRQTATARTTSRRRRATPPPCRSATRPTRSAGSASTPRARSTRRPASPTRRSSARWPRRRTTASSTRWLPAIADVPVWVVEGAAAFAGDDVAGANVVSASGGSAGSASRNARWSAARTTPSGSSPRSTRSPAPTRSPRRCSATGAPRASAGGSS